MTNRDLKLIALRLLGVYAVCFTFWEGVFQPFGSMLQYQYLADSKTAIALILLLSILGIVVHLGAYMALLFFPVRLLSVVHPKSNDEITVQPLMPISVVLLGGWLLISRIVALLGSGTLLINSAERGLIMPFNVVILFVHLGLAVLGVFMMRNAVKIALKLENSTSRQPTT